MNVSKHTACCNMSKYGFILYHLIISLQQKCMISLHLKFSHPQSVNFTLASLKQSVFLGMDIGSCVLHLILFLFTFKNLCEV